MTELSKPIKLDNLLTKENVAQDENVRWQYYGYGIYNCEGFCKRKDLPHQVKLAKCFGKDMDTYLVDGAL